jgi:transcriptional regulator with XRE-family HTH domain
MARGHLKWSVAQLAKAAGVGVSTIKRMEASDGVPSVAAKNLAAVQRTIEAAGLLFIPENGGGAGVRLRERAKEAPD